MRELIEYYQIENPAVSFSRFKERDMQHLERSDRDARKLVQIISYSPMPTHIHLALKQLIDNGISIFMRKILDSYSRYFNLKHRRKGPLWEGRFKRVHVGTDEQLLHLTRYIHLNAVTDRLVDRPEDWKWSSYNEYLCNVDPEDRICEYDDVLDINPASYKQFVEDRISYQRELKKIKGLLLD